MLIYILFTLDSIDNLESLFLSEHGTGPTKRSSRDRFKVTEDDRDMVFSLSISLLVMMSLMALFGFFGHVVSLPGFWAIVFVIWCVSFVFHTHALIKVEERSGSLKELGFYTFLGGALLIYCY